MRFWHYSAYGLHLASNRPIPSLPCLNRADIWAKPPDLQICFDSLSPWLTSILNARQTRRYVSPYSDENGQPALVVWLTSEEPFYRFHYAEGIEYVLSGDGARLWLRSSSNVAERDIMSYLLGPIMGFALRVRDIVCLHASAVAVGGHAIVFIGDAGAGKSTTAMALGRLGYPIISDDIVPICRNNGVILAVPGYPRMRLRQAALPMLSNINPKLPPLPAPDGEHRLHFALTTEGYWFQSEPLPIGALYLLAGRDAEGPRLESVSPVEGLVNLVANTYASRFLDRSMRAHEFDQLSQLADEVPLRKLYGHEKPSHLITLCNTVLKDLADRSSVAPEF